MNDGHPGGRTADSRCALTLVILAAGLSSRYGRLKQLEPVGPCGEALMDYGLFDAARAGFDRVVVVVRREIHSAVREHLDWLVQGSLEIALVNQTIENLPSGYEVPLDRAKPWGTAHALLAAEGQVRGPFAVCNADDFYGAAAYAALAEHLRGDECRTTGAAALVGYRLDATLSDSGGVSRAICEVDDDGYLTGIGECKGLVRDGAEVVGSTIMGQPCHFDGAEPVSMNFWGFEPSVLPSFWRSFADFLDTTGQNTSAEFLIPTVVAEMVAAGKIRVRVIDSGAPWMGVTFPDDKPGVATEIRMRVARDEYPGDLTACFRNH